MPFNLSINYGYKIYLNRRSFWNVLLSVSNKATPCCSVLEKSSLTAWRYPVGFYSLNTISTFFFFFNSTTLVYLQLHLTSMKRVARAVTTIPSHHFAFFYVRLKSCSFLPRNSCVKLELYLRHWRLLLL